MGISLDGLASGLDTTLLINQLMTIEAMPQTLMIRSKTTASSALTDFQSLNTRLATLLEQATKAAGPGGMQRFTTTASDSSVTAVAGDGAATGALDLTVTRTASSHVQVTAPMTTWPATPPVLTVVRPDGTRTEVTAASGSLADVALAVTNADLGITATRVQAGVDASGTPQYRLQFSSTETGAAAAFQIFQGDEAAVDAGTAVDLATVPGAALVRQAQDAAVTLWPGTAAAQEVTSASNTFDDLLPGVDVTVSKATTEPVSVVVGQDLTASSQAAQTFVDQVKSVLSFITQKQATSKSTDADGNPVTNLGSFTSDSNIRTLQQALVGAIQAPVDGASLSPYGISVTKDGVLEFDAEKFQKALAAEPAKVQAAFTAIAERVTEVATRYSDKYEGLLTKQIENRQSQIEDMDDQISAWTRRLEQREGELKRTYAALEVAMSTMNSQATYLSSQLAGLPTWNPSK
jgi:flagellar hook-associated protein 2